MDNSCLRCDNKIKSTKEFCNKLCRIEYNQQGPNINTIEYQNHIHHKPLNDNCLHCSQKIESGKIPRGWIYYCFTCEIEILK